MTLIEFASAVFNILPDHCEGEAGKILENLKYGRTVYLKFTPPVSTSSANPKSSFKVGVCIKMFCGKKGAYILNWDKQQEDKLKVYREFTNSINKMLSNISCLEPTLEEFLDPDFKETASYITSDSFSTLCLRKSDVAVKKGLVRDSTSSFRCFNVVTISTIQARNPGRGAFKRLVEWLKDKGYAIYIESVLSERFEECLLKLGFEEVNKADGNFPCYLFAKKGQTMLWEINKKLT